MSKREKKIERITILVFAIVFGIFIWPVAPYITADIEPIILGQPFPVIFILFLFPLVTISAALLISNYQWNVEQKLHSRGDNE